MAKKCNHENCNNPVFGGGYCKFHQYDRKDKKKSYIKPISTKRVNDNEKYNEVRELKKEELIKENKFICFFSGEEFTDDEPFEWHHLCGKEGKLLYDYDNIFPVKRKYHTLFHHTDILFLIKSKWYIEFLVKCDDLSKTNEKTKCAFDKEARRINKMFDDDRKY